MTKLHEAELLTIMENDHENLYVLSGDIDVRSKTNSSIGTSSSKDLNPSSAFDTSENNSGEFPTITS
jgi:hypothetical protein